MGRIGHEPNHPWPNPPLRWEPVKCPVMADTMSPQDCLPLPPPVVRRCLLSSDCHRKATDTECADYESCDGLAGQQLMEECLPHSLVGTLQCLRLHSQFVHEGTHGLVTNLKFVRMLSHDCHLNHEHFPGDLPILAAGEH